MFTTTADVVPTPFTASTLVPTHGQPAYQRAKAIVFLWAHLIFAHWHGYEVVIVHSKHALPHNFIDAHNTSACVHFVEAKNTVHDLGLF